MSELKAFITAVREGSESANIRILASANVSVFEAGTNTLASLFDEDGNTLPNPFQSGPDGEAFFRPDVDGIYDIVFEKDGTGLTLPAVQIVDQIALKALLQNLLDLGTTEPVDIHWQAGVPGSGAGPNHPTVGHDEWVTVQATEVSLNEGGLFEVGSAPGRVRYIGPNPFRVFGKTNGRLREAAPPVGGRQGVGLARAALRYFSGGSGAGQRLTSAFDAVDTEEESTPNNVTILTLNQGDEVASEVYYSGEGVAAQNVELQVLETCGFELVGLYSALPGLEAIQNNRLDNLETKQPEQDGRLEELEKLTGLQSQGDYLARIASNRKKYWATGWVYDEDAPEFSETRPGHAGFDGTLHILGDEITGLWEVPVEEASDDPALLSRADLWFVEMWRHNVTQTGVALIGPHMHQREDTYLGIPLIALDEGFSAHSDRDNGAGGREPTPHATYYGVDWNALNAAQRETLLNDPLFAERTREMPNGEVVQQVPRMRTVVNNSNRDRNARGFSNSQIAIGAAVINVQPQGARNIPQDPSSGNQFYGYGSSSFTRFANDDPEPDKGVANSRNAAVGTDTLAFYAPIAFITRGNKGIWSDGTKGFPANPYGHAAIRNQTTGEAIPHHEYDPSNPDHPNLSTLADLFVEANRLVDVSGRPDELLHDDFDSGWIAEDLRGDAQDRSPEFMLRKWATLEPTPVLGRQPNLVIATTPPEEIGGNALVRFNSTPFGSTDQLARDPRMDGSLLFGHDGRPAEMVFESLSGNRTRVDIRDPDTKVRIEGADRNNWSIVGGAGPLAVEIRGGLYRLDDLDLPRFSSVSEQVLIGDPASPHWPIAINGHQPGDIVFAGGLALIDPRQDNLQTPAEAERAANPEIRYFYFRGGRSQDVATFDAIPLVVAQDSGGGRTLPSSSSNAVGAWRLINTTDPRFQLRSSDWTPGGTGEFAEDTAFIATVLFDATWAEIQGRLPLDGFDQFVHALVGDDHAALVHALSGRVSSGNESPLVKLGLDSSVQFDTGSPATLDWRHQPLYGFMVTNAEAGVKYLAAVGIRDERFAVQLYTRTLRRDPDDNSFNDDGVLIPRSGTSGVNIFAAPGTNGLRNFEACFEVETNIFAPED